jgi:nitrate reductase cytochrome c-type subunit
MTTSNKHACSFNWNGAKACTNEATHFYTTFSKHSDKLHDETCHCCFCDIHYHEIKPWIDNDVAVRITEEEYIIEEVLKK